VDLESTPARSRDIQVVANKVELYQSVAEAFVDAAAQAILERGRFFVALSGGSTPRALHSLLASDAFRGRVAWNKVHFFWGDERCVPPDHEDSNFRMAQETLLTPLDIPAANIHRFRTELEDRTEVAEKYEQELAKFVGSGETGTPPRLDLVLLGMGADGHTASLFPHTTALTEQRRWVVANKVPQLETTRFTFTASLINAARQIWFLVSGADKALRLNEILFGPADPQRLPSQLIRTAQGRVRWFVDQDAASPATAED